jgi:hypothetical protein
MMHEGQWMNEGGAVFERPLVRYRRPTVEEEASHSVVNQNEARTGTWSWLQLLVLVTTILVFAGDLCYHFASLEWHHLPPEQRVNNGTQPTFFAFHIDPYYDFSEDFHLYYVRAKRIAQRGWTDSLLYSRPDARPSYVAPIQVALSSLAIMTDGRPIWYAAYMFFILAMGWTTFLVAARCWLPKNVSSGSLALAVLITVLVEAVEYLFGEPKFASFGIWPLCRGLRMSTMAWTSPMLVAVMIGLSSLLVEQKRWRTTIAALAVMLVLLLGTDNWAFALAWVATGLTTTALAANAALARYRSGKWPEQTRQMVGTLAVVTLATFAIHAKLSSGIQGDVLLRSGFGPQWHGVDQRKDRVPFMWLWLPIAAIPMIIVWSMIRLELVPTTIKGAVLVRAQALRRSPLWTQIGLLALLPFVTTPALYLILKWIGAEPFLRYQLYWRANYCFLFPLALAVLEWLRISLLSLKWRVAKHWAIVMAVAVAALFVYHDHRVYWYVKYIARKEFFLTADSENLRSWLKDFERTRGRFELATASPELNYLSAYWTNADLLLPSGFPYHNAASNQEIEDRTLQLLHLYHASKKSWLDFSFPAPNSFCDIWPESRVAASGEGYIYHLFHRYMTLTRPGEPRFNELERISIGETLRDQSKIKLPTPDVIILDPVSRALGRPNLDRYTKAFSSGTIEAWVRNDEELLVDKPKAHQKSSRQSIARVAAGQSAAKSSATKGAQAAPNHSAMRLRSLRGGWR